jgi:hypothetical protein
VSPLQESRLKGYTWPVATAAELENILRDLPAHGTLIKTRPYRQVWRFEWQGKGYYLKFYPRQGGRLKRLVRGSPAWREFVRLQLLQKKKVPAPRVVSHLSGYSINGVKGDAVILEAIEPSAQLDRYLNDRALTGELVAARERYELGKGVLELVHKLGLEGMGHSDLHLGNILRADDGKLYLLDGYAVRTGGMRMRDIQLLAYSVGRWATRAEIVRGWDLLMGGGRVVPPGRKNAARRRQYRKFLESARKENQYFGKITLGGWSGNFFKYAKFPRRWSRVSQMEVAQEDWERAWPDLLARIETDQLEVIKRSDSGDVLAGHVALGGRPVDVIIKRPRRKRWVQYISEFGRGARSWRAWIKAWSLIVRDAPTAWPMLVMEKRVLGYVIDSVIVFERVQGRQLADLNLNALPPASRQDLFRRLGRTLRELEQKGLNQYDSKATNWIVLEDEKLGPVPVIVDVDGIRRWVPAMWPIERLLRSMREHPQYTPGDSKELCLGYAPWAKLMREQGSGFEAAGSAGQVG